jgi:hypothetical protein
MKKFPRSTGPALLNRYMFISNSILPKKTSILSDLALPSPRPCLPSILVRIEQPVHVDDIVAHHSIVDGALRGGSPSVMRLFIIRVNANNIEVFRILEFVAAQAFQLTAKDEMQKLL